MTANSVLPGIVLRLAATFMFMLMTLFVRLALRSARATP